MDATDFHGLSVLIRRIHENPRFQSLFHWPKWWSTHFGLFVYSRLIFWVLTEFF